MAGYSVTFSVVDQATAKIDQINRRIQQLRAPLERQARAMQRFVDVSGLGKMAEGFNNIARGGLEAFSSLFRLIPVVGQLGAVAVATAAGMGKLAKSWAAFANPLTRDADQIGTTAATLETLQDATRAAGGSVDDMTESLKGLTSTAAGAFTGRDPNALAWFNRANINLRDMNGHLRTTTDLLPEVLRYLDSLKNPADRMTAAVNLSGTAVYNLTETLLRAQRPGETLTQTFERLNAAAAKRQMLTKADEASLRDYNAAVGDLDNAMIHLEHSAGGAAARGITPLLRGITLLIDAVSALTAGIARMGAGLAAAFALAAKNFWEAIAPIRAEIDKMIDRLRGLGNVPNAPAPYGGAPAAPGPTINVPGYGNVPNKPGPMRPGPAAPGGQGALQPAVPYQPGTLKSELGITGGQYDAFRNSVAKIESGGKYDIVGGAGGHFIGRYQLGGLGGHPELADTAKRLGVATPDIQEFRKNPQEQERFFEAYTAEHNQWLMKNSAKYRALSPEQKLAVLGYAHNQGAGGAKHWLESGQAGRDAFGTSGTKYADSIAAALAKVPQQVAAAPPGALIDLGQYRSGLAPPRATGAPAQVTGGAPVNGSVDVTITHKNPPPSDTLAATSTGNGINLAPPRTERQQLNAA